METIRLRNSVTVSVGLNRAARVGTTRLYVDAENSIYAYFQMPILPAGAVITSAKLRSTPGATSSTSVTINVHKVAQAFDPGSLTWPAQPSVGSQVATQTHAFNTAWEWDVTTHVSAVLSGEQWFGWRLSSSASTALGLWLYGPDTPYAISLDIEYEPAPQKPTNLWPDANSLVTAAKPILNWTTPGASNGAQQFQFQVQVDDASDFATPTYDSGTQSGTSSQFDLGGTAMTALTNGQSRYWRVRVRNQANVWGPWSDAAQWTYRLMSAVTVTAPATTTNDPTPLVTWTYSGTQVAKQVIVQQASAVPGGAYETVHDSGILYNATLSYQLPSGVVLYELRAYRIIVRVWDSASPVVSLTGAPSWREATKDFQWDASGVTPAVDVVVVGQEPFPHRIVTWQYTAAAPSQFLVYRTRNGVRQHMVTINYAVSDAADARPQWHAWTDRLVPGRAEVTYEVVAYTPGVGTSENNPTETLTVRNKVPWIISSIDYSRYFCLVNADINPGLSEVSELVLPAQGKPYLTIQQLQGFMGSASGLISSETFPGETAEDMKNDLLWIRENPRVLFTWQDQAIECYIYGVAFVPIGVANGETDYAVSFNFVEV